MMHSAVRPYLMDLGSANGTYLNNERIEAERYYELLERVRPCILSMQVAFESCKRIVSCMVGLQGLLHNSYCSCMHGVVAC